MILSAIDIQWPGDLYVIVPALERLGYYRFWTTEHHSGCQSASPLVAAAILCGLTTTIRIGTAGVLLQFASPFQVYEAFRLLETFYPGRLDLGVAGASSGDKAMDQLLLDGRPAGSSETYERKVAELCRLVDRGFRIEEYTHSTEPLGGPIGTTHPPLWVCGCTSRSAKIAGRLGVSYSFHDFLGRPRHNDLLPIDVYRQSFLSNSRQPVPVCNIAITGACAPSDAEAASYWPSTSDTSVAGPPLGHTSTPDNPPLSFCGEPRRCRDQIFELADRYGVDEVVIECVGPDVTSRIRGYALLAEAMEMQPG